MTEVTLFIIISFVAVAAAIMMLLSQNAVHSALFLILNFACVAFLYLMLEAPFLAMIQIAVYAGAIMVLFLFVIMLLGADKPTSETQRFRWLTIVAVFLSALFLVASGLGLVAGQIDLFQPQGPQPQLRVIHAAPDAVEFDVFVDGEPIAEALTFREATDFITLPPGDHTLSLAPAGRGADSAIAFLPVTLENTSQDSNAYNVFAYGEGLLPSLVLARDDLSTVKQRTGRVIAFNGYTAEDSVSLVDLGPDRELDVANGAITDTVLAASLPQGAISESLDIQQGQAALAFVSPAQNVLYRLRDFVVERETVQMLVLVGERLFDESLRPVAYPIMSEATPSFGGPVAVGQLLFTRYLLPFEMVAVLLLAAMIGAIVLTHTKEGPSRRRQAERRKVSRPLTSVVATQTGQDLSQISSTEAADQMAEQAEPTSN